MVHPEARRALTTVIDDILAGADQGRFGQPVVIPDVVMELLVWRAVETSLMFFLSILLLMSVIALTGYVCTRKPVPLKNAAPGAYARYEESFWFFSSGTRTGMEALLMPILAVSLPGVILLFNLEWLQIAISPDIYLIKHGYDLLE